MAVGGREVSRNDVRQWLGRILRRRLRRLYQLLADSSVSTSRSGRLGAMVSRATRAVFGSRRIDRHALSTLIPSARVEVEYPWMSAFVQEDYKWPVRVIHTPIDGDRWFAQDPFQFGRVEGALVAGDGRVFDRRGRFLVDSAPSHLSRVIHPGPLHPPVSQRIEGTVLPLNWWAGTNNIYHWNRDVLSRAFVLRHLADTPVTLVFTRHMWSHQKHAASQLANLFPKCRVAHVDYGEWIHVDECIVPTQGSHRLGSGYLHPDVARFVRDVNIAGVEPSGSPIPVAWVSRAKSKHRRITNEEDVVRSLQRVADVSVLELEEYDYPSQMALMQRVDVLAGVFGAGLTHAYFTRGAGLVEVHSGNSRETHFATLAMSRSMPYVQVLGGECERNQDFEVDAAARDSVVRAVAEMLGD